MNNVLINACGIKSLGGINVLKSSIENINQHSNVSLLISDEKIKNELSVVKQDTALRTGTGRRAYHDPSRSVASDAAARSPRRPQ